jgi:hypothetical protein
MIKFTTEGRERHKRDAKNTTTGSALKGFQRVAAGSSGG